MGLIRRHVVCTGGGRGFPAERPARAVVESGSDCVEVFAGVAGQAAAFGEVLPQEAVGVLVRASLPGSQKQTGTSVATLKEWGAANSAPWSQVKDRFRQAAAAFSALCP